MDADVPVGPHLADQLAVLIAMAGGRFLTTALTRHATTNLEVIQRFVEVHISVKRAEGDREKWKIGVRRS